MLQHRWGEPWTFARLGEIYDELRAGRRNSTHLCGAGAYDLVSGVERPHGRATPAPEVFTPAADDR